MDARDPAKVVDQVRLLAGTIKSYCPPMSEVEAIVNRLTLKSHGVAAACKAASSGFDSHRRLETINCHDGLHTVNVGV